MLWITEFGCQFKKLRIDMIVDEGKTWKEGLSKLIRANVIYTVCSTTLAYILKGLILLSFIVAYFRI